MNKVFPLPSLDAERNLSLGEVSFCGTRLCSITMATMHFIIRSHSLGKLCGMS